MKGYKITPFGALWYGHQKHDHRRVWIGLYIRGLGELELHFMR